MPTILLKKSLVGNESGNLVVVLAIMGMIAGLIAYWSSLTGKVDSEIRTLGATQMTTFIRSDFKNTIKKTLSGTNSSCSLTSDFEGKFKNFTTSSENATYAQTFTDNSTTPDNEISLDPLVNCFFHPSRYMALTWTSLKITIHRTSEPNYMTSSSNISADIIVSFKNNGKPSVLKYQLKYRIDVLSLDRFGIIFTNFLDGKKFNLAASSKVNVFGPVLFDDPSRSTPVPLTNFMIFPETGSLIFKKEVFTSAPAFTSDPEVIDFLTTKTMTQVFTKGIEYDHLQKGSGFQAPYQINPSEWDERLDFTNLTDGFAPLPYTASRPSAHPSPTTTRPERTYDAVTNHFDTAEVYKKMKGNNHEKDLIDSCLSLSDLTGASPFTILIANNLNQNFTIDFTHNTQASHPPVFCGVIVAKDLIVKLNGQSATEAFYKHHFIGKLILSGKITVQNEGELNLHDLVTFTNDQYTYGVPSIDVSNLQIQFFNQKYYSTQNFFLPFFKTGKAPTLTSPADLIQESNQDRYFVPRGTKTFFQTECQNHQGFNCQLSPQQMQNQSGPPSEETLLTTHWQDLLFEVYDVE